MERKRGRYAAIRSHAMMQPADLGERDDLSAGLQLLYRAARGGILQQRPVRTRLVVVEHLLDQRPRRLSWVTNASCWRSAEFSSARSARGLMRVEISDRAAALNRLNMVCRPCRWTQQ
jgi:hypothetical protein